MAADHPCESRSGASQLKRAERGWVWACATGRAAPGAKSFWELPVRRRAQMPAAELVESRSPERGESGA